MSELDLLALDRALRAAELGLPAPLRARNPRIDEELLSELRSRAASDPLAAALEPWLFRALEARALQERLTAVEHAYRVEAHVLHEPEYTQQSLSQIMASALAKRSQRAAYLDGYLGAAQQLSASSLRLWDARQELAGSLDVNLDRHELAAPSLPQRAESWLALSADAFAELDVRDIAGFVTGALAESAEHGWPAQLSARSLSDLLADGPWFDGLQPRVGPLPSAYGAASFMRALALLGRALARATTSERVPFAFAGDLFGLKRHTHASVLASLPLLPTFLKRKLGLGAAQTHSTLRALATAVLLESRAAALRVLLRAPLLAGSTRLLAALPELSHRALGFELPESAALAFVRVHRDDAQRFAGMLLAAERAERLTQEHDDDWYRNPRAVAELREELEDPERSPPTSEALERGATRLHSALVALI